MGIRQSNETFFPMIVNKIYAIYATVALLSVCAKQDNIPSHSKMMNSGHLTFCQHFVALPPPWATLSRYLPCLTMGS